MANKNFIVKNGLEVGGQEVVSSSGVVTSAALGGQTLASTDSPTFNNLTLTNDIAVGGDINLTGDLNITGDVNSVSVTDLDVTDQTITLGKGQAESASGGSGIVIDGSGASILWNEANTQFDINNALNVSSASTDVAKFVSAGSYTFIALDNATRDWALSAGSSFGIYDKDASATRLSIDASGNVGIGTSPSTALDVQGAIQASESGGDFIRMQTDGNNNIFDVNSGAYVFRTSGFSERMRINAAGGLSINDNIENPLSLNRTTTTTGASYMKFTNAGGNYYIGADSSLGDRMAIGGLAYGFTMTAESGRPLVFATSNTARMTIDSSGNIGIGTTSPNDGRLQVYNNDSGDWAGYFWNQNANGIGLHVETSSYGTEQLLRLSSLSGSGGSNVVRMAVLANGNVGIGTSSPNSTVGIVDIAGSASNYNTAPVITFRDTAATTNSRNWSIGNLAINYGDFHIGVGDTNSDYFDAPSHSKFMINKDGNVGIGEISPDDTLHVNAAGATARIRIGSGNDA